MVRHTPKARSYDSAGLGLEEEADIDFSPGADVFISAYIIHPDTGGNLLFNPNNSQILQ